MKRLRALRLITLLLLLLLVALLGLSVSPVGARIALSVAQHLSHGRLQIGQVDGSLFGTLELHDVRLREQAQGPLLLQVADAKLAWQPWQLLLAHRLQIHNLELTRPQLWLAALGASDTHPAPTDRLRLPPPPLPVRVSHLAIDGLLVHRENGESTGPIQASLQAYTDSHALHIRQLRLSAPAGRLSLSGQLQFRDMLPYQARLRWQTTRADGTRLAGSGSLQGDSEGLNFIQTSSLPHQLRLTGTVDWHRSVPSFTLNGDWHELILPVPGHAPMQASAGQLQVSGTAQAYRVELASHLAIPGIPPLDLQARAHGDSDSLQLDRLGVATLGGTLQATGQATWRSAFKARLALKGKGLEPQRQWAAWPGKLDFAAQVALARDAGKLQASYRLQSLSGELRGRQITGQARLTQQEDGFTLDRLVLQAGEDRLSAQGELTPAMNLNASLAAPRLSPWLSGSRASLSAQAQLGGTLQLPRATVAARLTASGQRPADRIHLDLDAVLDSGLTDGQRHIEGRVGLRIPEQAGNQLQARIALQAPGGNAGLSDAVLHGSLQGRLNVSRLLNSLAPDLAGSDSRIDADVHFDGKLGNPNYRGRLGIEERKLLIAQAGITLQDLKLELQGRNGDLALSGSAVSGNGRISLKGRLNPTGAQGPNLQLSIKGKDFLAADLPEAQVWIDPDLAVTASALAGVKLHGKVLVPRARLAPPQLAASAVGVSDDVVLVGQHRAPPTQPFTGRISADVQLQIGYPDRTLPQSCLNPDQPTPADCPGLSFDGYGLKAMLSGNLHLRQTGNTAPQVNGRLRVLGGRITGYGSDLSLLPGDVLFTGPARDPRLNLSAQRVVGSVTAGLRIGGTLKQLQTTLYSDPPLDHNEIMSYLLFGHSLEAGSNASSNSMLRTAGYSLAGDLLGRALAKPLGVDLSLATNSAGDQGLTVGRYLSPRVYVGYGLDLFDHSMVVKLVYQLTHHLSLQAKGGQASGLDLDFRNQWN